MTVVARSRPTAAELARGIGRDSFGPGPSSIPDRLRLSEVEAEAQSALQSLVEAAGGRFASKTSIPVGHLDQLTPLLDAWGRRQGIRTEGRIQFMGRPGLWRALDQLYPLEDPRRWDMLRKAILIELVENGSWYRVRPPRGMVFIID